MALEALKQNPKLAKISQCLDHDYKMSQAVNGSAMHRIAGKRYLNMQTEMENENEPANSKEKRIYRKNVA